MKNYDVAVIGGGPGGYVAALRAAQLGLKTACVDERTAEDGKPAPGGTCLNVGCIPSKALLDSSHLYHDLSSRYAQHGIAVSGASVDVSVMQKRKDKVVKTLTRGVASLLRKQKVDLYCAHATFLERGRIALTGASGEEELRAAQVVIATGSHPAALPVAPFDGTHIVDSTGALAFDSVPARLGIVGAGVIGLELGSVWRRLGAEVVLLEALPDFLGPVDRDIAKAAQRDFARQGLDIRLGAKVQQASVADGAVSVKYASEKAGEQEVTVDRLVVAVGRRPHTEGLGLEKAGLALDAGGRIEVDEHCRTAVEGLWAIGDVVRGPMLAHKASDEGIAVAEAIAGHAGHCDLSLVPWVIYTHPEIAWVGETEAALQERGVAYRAGAFPFAASGRAQAAGETLGMVKMIAEAQTDRLLGVHIYGAHASELIAEAVTAMAFDASSEDLARTIHAHPTLAETLHEAALAVDGRALHV